MRTVLQASAFQMPQLPGDVLLVRFDILFDLRASSAGFLRVRLCAPHGAWLAGRVRSTEQHLETDHVGIHDRICKLLKRLRRETGFLGSEDERQARANEVHALRLELLVTARRTGHKLLFEGKNELAMPAALHSLRFAIDLYGANHIELVPSYLLLGEGSIRLARFKEAEEYLSLAKWALLKCDDAPFEVRAELARNFGLLYAAQGRHAEALRHLANDAYYCASVFGPDHVNTTTGYFLLGTVFYAMRNDAALTAMFARVVDVWKSHLSRALDDARDDGGGLDEAKQAEALKMLGQIVSVRRELCGEADPRYGEALYVLALLYEVTRRSEEAREMAAQALAVFQGQQSPDAAQVEEVETLLALIDESLGQ